MLNDDERREIEAQLPQYPARRAAVVDALNIVQSHRGWLSDESVADVAALLEMSPAEVDSAATFCCLLHRKPVGRHVILLCDSVSCWILGSDALQQHLTSRLGIGLGETTADGRFTLLPVACLGACEQAPAIMIDGDLHGNLDPDKIDRVLQSYM